MQNDIKNRTLDWRNLDYYINTYKFIKGWELANKDELEHIRSILKNCDIFLLKRLINKIISKDIEEKTLHELREIASMYGILNYSIYTKTELYDIVKEKLKNDKR